MDFASMLTTRHAAASAAAVCTDLNQTEEYSNAQRIKPQA
jgi:hypothetical protein